MIPDKDRFGGQGDHNWEFCLRLRANRPDLAGWKAAALFYSALHKINHLFKTRTGRVPRSHAERSRRIKAKMRDVFDGYYALYLPSRRARYCEGFRLTDEHRALAAGLMGRIEAKLSRL